jgi:putative glycosyltransferase (TIGR04348 family)
MRGGTDSVCDRNPGGSHRLKSPQRMRIGIVTPAPPNSRSGNRITALRWAKILRRLGNRVSILQAYHGERYDLLVALHARRSYPSIHKFWRQNSDAQIIVALTGTDLYRDLRRNRFAQMSLEIANKIVVLQPKAIEELRPGWRYKARVIYQSAEDLRRPASKTKANKAYLNNRSNGSFDVCVIGHLRAVKDPFRAALAAASLPCSSRIRILQIGGAMTEAMAARARKEMRANPRYEWLGELPRPNVRRILAMSQLSVVASRIEGGANVVSEAITASVPILASRIDGNVGILGANYPGLFEVGHTQQLARLLARAESDREYLGELRERCQKLAPLFDPAREEKAWADLISELFLIESE